MDIKYLELVGVSIIGAVAQLTLKKGSQKTAYINSFFTPWIMVGVVLLVINTIFFTLLLKNMDLTKAIPITSLIYVFTPLGAQIFFKEKIKIHFWVGTIFIIIGISLITMAKV